MQTHSTTTTVTDQAEVLTYGTELVRCPICQTALVPEEACPHRCRVDHRGRRRSPRPGFDRVRAPIDEAADGEASRCRLLLLAQSESGPIAA
jgi:hypothetical protein